MISYIILSTGSLLFCYLIYIVLLKKHQNFNFNRIYLLIALVGSATFPVLEISPIYENQLTTDAAQVISNIAYATNTPVGGESSISWLTILYLTGASIFLVLLLVKYGKLSRFLSKHQFIKKEDFRIINTNGQYPTSSFWNILLWNNQENLDPDQAEKVQQHELKHIRERHTFDIIVFEILRVVFWFNPIMNFYKHAIVENHEYIADKAAIIVSTKDDYILLLTKQLLNQFEFSTVSHFNNSLTQNRIDMIKSNPRQSFSLRHAIALVLITGVMGVVSCDSQTPYFSENGEVYSEVDKLPELEDGIGVLYEGIASSMKYPEEARKMGIEGKVFVQFIVNKDGSASEFQVVKGIGAGCDKAAVEAVKDAASNLSWGPGIKEGKKVRTKMVLPVTFKLGDGAEE